MKSYKIKLLPGDGIGVDVIREGKRVLEELSKIFNDTKFVYDEYDWGCEYYLKHGKMMPDDGISILSDGDAILLGAVGFPTVPDHISLRGLLLPIRQEFNQYVNMRPIKLLKGLVSPLNIKKHKDIDFVVIRENSEGEYCGEGEFTKDGAIQYAKFTRKATERIIHYAFKYAQVNNCKSVVSATKSNALNYSMVFWDEVFNSIKTYYDEIDTRLIHVDALAGFFIMKPQMFEVVVASNLFGDILTDLGSAMLGSIGISPSANINPEKKYPSMFEPVHGSAPDIAGKGIANPIGTIWSIEMMLSHLGLGDMSQSLMVAMKTVIEEGIIKTPDLGGNNTTSEVVDEIITKLTLRH